VAVRKAVLAEAKKRVFKQGLFQHDNQDHLTLTKNKDKVNKIYFRLKKIIKQKIQNHHGLKIGKITIKI
jgi:hypothetical protein